MTYPRLSPDAFEALTAAAADSAAAAPLKWGPLLRFLSTRKPYAYGGSQLVPICLKARPDLASDLHDLIAARLDSLHYSEPTFSLWFGIYTRLRNL